MDHEKYIYSMIGEAALQVSRANGKILRFNFSSRAFEECLI